MNVPSFDGLADVIVALSLASLLLPLLLGHLWRRREAHMTEALQAKLGSQADASRQPAALS